MSWTTFYYFFLFIFTTSSLVAETRCFQFSGLDSPENIPNPTELHQTWCYEQTKNKGGIFDFAYNIDSGSLRPEMSMLVERDAKGKVLSITHGSLMKGEVSFHKSSGFNLNPYNVPFTFEEARRKGKVATPANTLELQQASVEILGRLKHEAEVHTFAAIEEGVFESYLPEEQKPFSAYWWPYDNNELAVNSYTPLGKYDAMVLARTGTDPHSRNWELSHHSPAGVAWGGHCNGWAASAVLHPEPTKYLWDASIQKVIMPSDIEGMLAEASFCVDWAFYGRRYYGGGDDSRDIYPDKFHKVLMYYIESLKKPVALDRHSDDMVDNSVITGYRIQIRKDLEVPNRFNVTATTRMHYYPDYRNEDEGAARARSTSYIYSLDVDNNGEIISSEWVSDNPDFLWVPLSQKKCGRENPNIEHTWVQTFMETLPEAQVKTLPVNLTYTGEIPAGESVEIFNEPLNVFKPILRIGEVTAEPGLYLYAYGTSLYPNYHSDLFVSEIASDQSLYATLSTLRSLILYNSTDKPIPTTFHLQSIEYLGGD